MGQFLLEDMSIHEIKKVTRTASTDLIMGESCLINLTISDRMTGCHSLLFSTGVYLEYCTLFFSLPDSYMSNYLVSLLK